MYDLDVVRLERQNADRTVRIGGQELTFKPGIHAEALARWLDGRPQNEMEALAESDEFVVSFLEPDSVEKWLLARSPDNPAPISTHDIRELIRHVLEVVVNRPTERESGSSSMPSPTGMNSTESSPLAEAKS